MSTRIAMNSNLPVAVIGAGPVGLAAAAHLLARGLAPLVLEAGPGPGSSILEWGHVRLFSPWNYVVDPEAGRLLAPTGWQRPPEDEYPNGRELVERYLRPLSQVPALRDAIRYDSRVVSVSRAGFDRQKSDGRERAPFVLRVRHGDGRESDLFARAVVDASGTWHSPNPAGADGRVALGERALGDRVAYGIPDVRGPQRARWAGRRTLVLGSGHSAFNALLDLLALAEEAPGTEVVWAVRRTSLGSVFGGGLNDQLAERGKLGQRLRAQVEAGRLRIELGFRLERFERLADGSVVARSADGALAPVDQIVVATGFRPEVALLSELRTQLDPVTEAPAALAPLIDPNVHSCGTVRPHGFAELKHPEPDLYVIGMKSYGRAPTFLLLTGYEQARSVAAALAGDMAAAREVRLLLPETGVCGGSGRDDGASVAGGCCGGGEPAGAPQQITLRRRVGAGAASSSTSSCGS
ncbi:MAG: NAD(P)-binding domain-containing protein [Vicinamibacteria bacterium]|nr:NAD(P)-binding domain-containing protein [Vicinamibacteria bacterium]